MSRREVRVTDQFFDRLDDLLPAERSAGGVPSAADFLLLEMPRVVSRLASDWERATLPTSKANEVRVLVTDGLFGRSLAFYTALAADGWVEVFYLDMD